MYKFEIYRNPERPQSINGYDAVRYHEDGYIFERTITPKWSDLSFSWEKDGERAFYRKKLGGSFTLIGSDFEWANGIRLNATERNNKYRSLIIKELIDDVWTQVWRGFFSVIAGEWDLSNCSTAFSELVIWDEYTEILENIENEKNMLDLLTSSTGINIKTSAYEYDVHEVVEFLVQHNPLDPCTHLNTNLPPLGSSDIYYNDPSTPYDDKWTLYDRRVRFIAGDITPPIGVTSDNYFEVIKTYRRDYVEQVTDPGSGWVDTGEVKPGDLRHKWVRHYLGYDDPPTPIYDVIKEKIYIFSAFGNSNPTWEWCEYDRRTLNIENAPGIVDYVNKRARPFRYVVNYVFINDPYPYIYSSFFNLETNPITNTDNDYGRMYLIQFTDIIETSDPAHKAMYSAKDVEEWLRLMNVYWYREYTETNGWMFRFEHSEFFKRGLTYEENSIGIDLSGMKVPRKMDYDNKNLPRVFELTMSYDSGDDFNGTPIIYGGGMANWDKEGKDSISSGSIATDVRAAVLNEDAGKEGFFLVATELNGYYPNIISGTGAWSGTYIYNQPLSIANIEQDLFIQRGVTAVGEMNGEPVEFDAVENNFTQSGVEVTWCDDFDPYKLVRTDYGDAVIVSAELRLKDKRLTLTLSYEE